jgi:signal transduction histidine kinase
LISKLINELNQKNEAIIKLKEQEIKKNEKITDLTERLKRHEANNLLMRISTRLELMSVELIKAGRKCESEKLEVDIKRLSQMFENEIEIKLFTVIREIKYLMSKRFDDVEILLVNAIEHKNTKIKPILVQIIYILVENSYEAGAKTVRISTENESLIISDDGPGFDTNKIQYGYSTKNKSRSGIIGGYGLQTAIDYLELNNVGFDIRSRLNEGTTIKLSNFKNLGIV